ncbi:DUF4145 domain-containing protein [Pseudomonas nabeulensis]|uniref:DUF4145 domain-containing protein n=1 Tax=Pseudomonas nabeulensis TaxID=2293833 RepID=A0A4Z0AWU8_9PSED|nr:DUF4145 domain-containing protein [Pseudomonas nabeulensis]TFY91276.1 DUF4145 domain-containing protein [Pseudomonas nabeulensis]
MGQITKSFQFAAGVDEQEKHPCKKCCIETNHKLVASYTENGSEDCGGGHSVDWTEENEIIQCLGCEEVSFRICSTNSEEYDHDYDSGDRYYIPTITYYPGRALGSKIIDHWALPWEISAIYKESRTAVENELFIIGGIAIRTLLESICTDVQAKGRNLVQKIDDLHVRSLVTKEGVETLHKIRLLGNRAAHKAKAHSKDQLLLALEVIEHILIGTYIIPGRAKAIFKNLNDVKKLPAPAPAPAPAPDQ